MRKGSGTVCNRLKYGEIILPFMLPPFLHYLRKVDTQFVMKDPSCEE